MDISVSIIVPAFNASATIRRCLDSIIPQMDRGMELIVIDDASEDDTLRILMDGYRTPSVHILHSTVNHGAAYSRNDGIRFSRGSMLTFCDADDEWLPGKLQAQVSFMEAHPETDIVFVRNDNVLDDDTAATRQLLGMADDDRQCHFFAAMVRRSVFDKAGLLDDSMRVREDTEWLVRAMTSGARWHTLEDTLYLRHLRESGVSSSVSLEEGDRGRRKAEAFVRGIRRKTFKNVSGLELSILIPCRNAARYVAQAVASCKSSCRQEIIVVDDGSDDGSAAQAIKALADCGIPATIAIRAHRGQAASRNDALSLARGQWIMYLDADDYFFDGAIDEAMRQARQADADVSLLSFLCRDFISPELTPEQAARLSAKSEPYRRMLAGCMLIRKSLFDSIGGFNEALPSSETAQWVLSVRESGARIFDSDFITLARRYHLTNFGRTNRTTQMESYLAIIRARLQKK
ncbi:MAG: glycosyltransferase family 2 protein [Candidatus Cryptobacteroides sp.]